MELIGECKGNDGNGCFMDSCGHDCGCFVRESKQETIEEVFDWLTTNNYLTDLKETLIKDFNNFKKK